MSSAVPIDISRNQVFKHLLLGLLAIALVALIINLLGRELIDFAALRAWVSGFGPKAPVVFVGVFTLAHLVFLPVAPFALAALAMFHWPVAIACILISHNLAANIGYALPLVVGAERIHRLWTRNAQLEELDHRLQKRGFATVLALRIVPVLPFSVVSYISALSCIRWRDYALASFLGFIPGSVTMAIVLSHGAS